MKGIVNTLNIFIVTEVIKAVTYFTSRSRRLIHFAREMCEYYTNIIY